MKKVVKNNMNSKENKKLRKEYIENFNESFDLLIEEYSKKLNLNNKKTGV